MAWPYLNFTCAILICNIVSISQTVERYIHSAPHVRNYKFIIETPLYECNILGEVSDNAVLQVAEPGAIFTLVGKKDDDTAIIRFWTWKENKALNAELCFADSLGVKRKYFVLPYSALQEKAIPRYDRKPCFTAGTVTILIPVKLRPHKFDFSKDLTLGPVAGAKFRLSSYTSNFISVLAGLGITSITLDSRSTNGNIEEDTDVPALTPSLGVVFDFLNSSQAGIFIGWDFISNNENINLIYYGKMWISFGLGFSILTKGSATSAEQEFEQ